MGSTQSKYPCIKDLSQVKGVLYEGTTGMGGTRSGCPCIKDLSKAKGVCSMDEQQEWEALRLSILVSKTCLKSKVYVIWRNNRNGKHSV